MIIAFLLLFFVCGIFIFPFVFSYDEDKPLIKRLITSILATTIFVGIFGGCLYLERARYDNDWNNGYCPTCGIHWSFKSGSHYRTTTKYFYECENCHNVIETSRAMR